MSEPIITVDVEIVFASGAKDWLQVTVGRDMMDLSSDPLRFVINHEDGAIETIEISRAALACLRTARRIVKDEPTPDQVIERQLAAAANT